jgi:hypothetical protein
MIGHLFVGEEFVERRLVTRGSPLGKAEAIVGMSTAPVEQDGSSQINRV